MRVHGSDELRPNHLEGVEQRAQHLHRESPFASVHTADVGAMKRREAFLDDASHPVLVRGVTRTHADGYAARRLAGAEPSSQE